MARVYPSRPMSSTYRPYHDLYIPPLELRGDMSAAEAQAAGEARPVMFRFIRRGLFGYPTSEIERVLELLARRRVTKHQDRQYIAGMLDAGLRDAGVSGTVLSQPVVATLIQHVMDGERSVVQAAKVIIARCEELIVHNNRSAEPPKEDKSRRAIRAKMRAR